MSFLPVPINDDGGLTPRQMRKAQRIHAGASLAVFQHAVGAQSIADMDRADSQAIGDASRTALDEELDLLDYGLARAGRSAAKTELVARHVERMAAINDRRITKRFGRR